MNEDRVVGTATNLGGKAQEGLDRASGDVSAQAKGVINQAAGTAQELYGQAKESLSDAAEVVRQRATDVEDIRYTNDSSCRRRWHPRRPHDEPSLRAHDLTIDKEDGQ
jgi:uncharacterized protein YjbJ (UPF0337 family)